MYIYDVELLDYRYSYALLDGNDNSDVSNSIVIGEDAVIVAYGYIGKDLVKNSITDYYFFKSTNYYGKIIDFKAFNVNLTYQLIESTAYEYIVYIS